MLAHNSGGLAIPEGLILSWTDALCRVALETGQTWIDNASVLFPASSMIDSRIITYTSAPVVLHDGTIFGTLCGADRRSIGRRQDTIVLINLAARLIAGAIEPGQEHLEGAVLPKELTIVSH